MKELKGFTERDVIDDLFNINTSLAWAREMYDETRDPAFLRLIESCEDQLNSN